jgi:hypothetical protein
MFMVGSLKTTTKRNPLIHFLNSLSHLILCETDIDWDMVFFNIKNV